MMRWGVSHPASGGVDLRARRDRLRKTCV